MSGTLHDWITRAAEARPGARAVIGEDCTLTYEDIEIYSNHLASVLGELGCENGDRVGVLFPKSAMAVATFVGVLKAGCAYVPLDPQLGNVKTAEMLRQCQPRVLLAGGCDAAVVEDLSSRNALRDTSIGWLGEGRAPAGTVLTRADVASASDRAPDATIRPHDLACILFTSGTMGKPKAVPITHESARAFIDWVVSYFELGPEDRLSGHTALTVDLSILDIYATFAAGAELHLVPSRALLVPHEIAAFIEQRRLTSWFSPPSQLAYVARFDALKGRDISSLRHVAWCGDVLTPSTLLHWKERLPGASFTNLYGPTETTVASSYYTIPDDYRETDGSIPIGYACPGETLLVLDENMQPTKDGEVGDIYIGGVGLSPGYWRNPERTRASFLPDPTFHCNGSGNGNGNGTCHRVYRTGDRGRRRPDGAVTFVGRSDFQIRTAGHRVEPAEVEHAISKLREVAACAVVPVTVGDRSGRAIGCAYVPKNGAPLRTGELKKLLADELPAYMLPTRWLVLSDLPTDGRGKIDRPRLQALMGG